MLKQHVVPESLASEGLMNIIRKTQELLEELGRLRLEFVCRREIPRLRLLTDLSWVDELWHRWQSSVRPECQQGGRTTAEGS